MVLKEGCVLAYFAQLLSKLLRPVQAVREKSMKLSYCWPVGDDALSAWYPLVFILMDIPIGLQLTAIFAFSTPMKATGDICRRIILPSFIENISMM